MAEEFFVCRRGLPPFSHRHKLICQVELILPWHDVFWVDFCQLQVHSSGVRQIVLVDGGHYFGSHLCNFIFADMLVGRFFYFIGVYGFSACATFIRVIAVSDGVSEVSSAVPLFYHRPHVGVISIDEPDSKEEDNGCDAKDVSGQMGVIGDGVSGEFCFDDIIPDNHFEDDEIQRRQVKGSDEKEPIQDGDDGSGEQYQICAGYSGDGSTCSENGIYVQKCVSDAGKDPAGQIETSVADVAELVVYIVAEQIEKVHVSEYVH